MRTALTPLSWLYSLGWRCYRLAYKTGLKKPQHPHKSIVCVGSLQVGGSGKTPVTLFVAEKFLELGNQVVIGCSGYGSPASEAAKLAPMGPLEASKWGDEPAMIRWLLPDVPIVVGRRRVLAAEICHKQFPDSILLMDDGFQHLPLRKDVSILVLAPGSNCRCLPAGPYREPLVFTKAADLVVPGEFSAIAQPLEFVLPDGSAAKAKGEVSALCALARPEGFFESLRKAGLTVADVAALSDHDPLTQGNLFGTWSRERPTIVTAKDWVKIRERNDIGDRIIWIAKYRVSVEPQDAFCDRIKQCLDEKEERV